jgi:hypothetical protein
VDHFVVEQLEQNSARAFI